MYTIWAGYTSLFVVTTILFFWSKTIQPIKARYPGMVLMSGIGGYLLVTNYAMAHYVTGIHRWPCPFSHWTLWLGFPLFLFPFPVRSLKLYLVFKRNMDKVKNHTILQKKTLQRVTVVEQRFSMSMNSSSGGGASDLQKAIENHKQKKEQRKKEKQKKAGKLITEEEIDPDNTGVQNPLTEVPAVPSGSLQDDTGTAPVSSPSAKGCCSRLYKKIQRTKAGSSVPSRGTVRIAEIEAAESGLINTQSNRSLLERNLLGLFFFIVALCFIIGLVRQFIPELGLGRECVGCVVSLSSAIVQTIIIFIVLGIQLLASVFIYAQQVKDQFKIGRELQIIFVIWFFLLFPACILALRGHECEALRTGQCSSYDNFTSFCYYNFAAQHWLIVGCVILTFLVTLLLPVLVTIYKGRKKLLNEPVKILWPKYKALSSLKECLAEPETSEAFQKFCVQSFCVENILFWKDAEQFRQVVDPNELRVRAIALYKRYIDASGNLFIQLPEEIQEDLENILGEAATKDEDEVDFDYNFQVDNAVFSAAQEEVFRQMENETFPQFLRSDAAKKLVQAFNSQAAQLNALKEQKLI